MNTTTSQRGVVRPTIALIAAMLAAAILSSVGGPGPAGAQGNPDVGIVCTESAGTSPTFTLTTRTGYIDLPDANTMFMWGYSNGSDGFQHPGPILCVEEGDTVTVILNNTLPEDVSIMFPGQSGVTADGMPVQPQFDGGGDLTSLTNIAAANGGTVSYSFEAGEPGTYLYQSGTDSERQTRLGLFGALIVRPASSADQVYSSADSEFNPNYEFMVLLSEIDPYLNQAAETAFNAGNPQSPFDMTQYQARYWLINGRGFPDSIAANGASWLPNQPYGALAQVEEWPGDGSQPPGLSRYLNVGSENYPFHPHGNHGRVIGRDGSELKGSAGQDLSFEKFAINVGPGQTWDVLFRWYDAEGYGPNNPVPVQLPSLLNQEIGVFYSGSPYLGGQEQLPPGTSSLNECGEYYIISHNHALFQIVSWGVNMTGPMTYMRINPAAPNGCS